MAEQTCRVTAQFFDDEGCEAACVLPAGHPGKVHKDAVIGAWDEDEPCVVFLA
ncbi:hypothetical protein OOK31_36720 [Streptomyces sp. NBC_00249]|uniref:hypothetical protein n=1 Tax=Streptomyces sp. NBC_00249 TaxID=2975690 RepID=UPI00225A8835|nr:hypothetical protein [Streptomyces sp. NBC_00249]MCX5199357.1 hypothetical protein [Streptomyces sp. NBC_00249]